MPGAGCYRPVGMKVLYHSIGVVISVCIALNACDVPKKNNSFDLYGMRPAGAVPVDNDSYYTAPKPASSCSSLSINDAPSCGGI